MTSPIRVLIVDDSRTHRAALGAFLARAPGLEVVGEATDGYAAVEATERLRPHVVLMDVRMPVLDGLEATRRIMAERPTPILLMTSAENLTLDVDLGLRALEYGALDLVPKPDFAALRRGADSPLIAQLRLLAGVPVISHPRGRRGGARHTPAADAAGGRPTGFHRRASRLVAVVASTGGPKALTVLLAGLPLGFKAAVVIVQHIDAGFQDGLVRWLDEHCPLPVCLAADQAELMEGQVYVAPQGRFAQVSERRRVALIDEPYARGAHCPSGDRLLATAAAAYGHRAVGVVLTGIGRDGAEGLLAIRDAGGHTIAQDEATSVVYGMPQAAARLGAAGAILALERIADELAATLR